jgi:hypothetical protein
MQETVHRGAFVNAMRGGGQGKDGGMGMGRIPRRAA